MESDDVITCCNNDLPCSSFASFMDMREREQLCDFKITIQDHSLVAHRVVVAAGIPYFRTFFTNSCVRSEGEEIALGDLNPDALESLINYAYSGKVDISNENVQPLLTASTFLQLNVVRDACAEFLIKRLDPNNVLSIHTLARNIHNLGLIESSSYCIRKNFEEVSKSEEFLSLPYLCIKDIITSDLDVSSEEIVFESVINWVKVAPLERQVLLPQLLGGVRMIDLPANYLVEKVATEELIKTSLPCRDLIDEVKNYHWLSKESAALSQLKKQPRKFVDADRSLLYAVCRSGVLYCHDSNEGIWNCISDMQNCYVYSIVAARESIYMFLDKSIQRFCLPTGKWQLLKHAHRHIYGAAILLHENVVYCFGSLNSDFAAKVCCFSIKWHKWLKERSMTSGRYYSAAASLGESIYVTGGYSGKTYLSTVEKYNPATDQWSDVAPMLTPRDQHGCTSLSGKIYVCGGYTLSGISRSAEVYDSFADQWNSICSLKNARYAFSLISHCRKIYAFGSGCKSVCDAETYDAESNRWKTSFQLPERFKFAVSLMHTISAA